MGARLLSHRAASMWSECTIAHVHSWEVWEVVVYPERMLMGSQGCPRTALAVSRSPEVQDVFLSHVP